MQEGREFMEERTLIIFKPDTIQRRLLGQLFSRFEQLGLTLVAVKMIHFTDELCRIHYQHLIGKDFFEGIVDYMTSGPCLAMVLAGNRAVAAVRHIVGATDPLEALPGTIRGDYALSCPENLVHASGSTAEAEEEIRRFFTEEELPVFHYQKVNC